MVSIVSSTSLDLSDSVPDAAREAIRKQLALDPSSTRRIYAALARKVWSLLIERRLDPEIRDWHSLLQSVRIKLRETDEAASERVTALADLVRESLNLAEISPARTVAERPRARAILEQLADSGDFMKRRDLIRALEIGSSHISNVLTKLLAYNLVERRESGKEAEYKISRLGLDVIGRDASDPAQIIGSPIEAVVRMLNWPAVPPMPKNSEPQHHFAWPIAAGTGQLEDLFPSINRGSANPHWRRSDDESTGHWIFSSHAIELSRSA